MSWSVLCNEIYQDFLFLYSDKRFERETKLQYPPVVSKAKIFNVIIILVEHSAIYFT
jgi:hypothetical protein